jgi:glycosyltransferase involved in cell wall biosynthesis
MRLRVLMVVEPPDGGVREYVMQLALGLGAHDVEVEIAQPPQARRYPALEATDTAVHELPLEPGFSHPLRDRRALGALRRLLGERPPFDIIHSHSSKAGVLSRMLRGAPPVVFTPNAFSFVGDFSRQRYLFASAVERGLAPRTAAIICCCEDERRIALEHHLGARRLHVVHNASAACDPSIEADAELLAIRGEGLLVGAVASLRPQKTLDVLIDATPAILAGNPRARVVIVGDGELRDELAARAASLGLADEPRFALLGFRAPAARALKALDLYVLPSAWEGFPLAVLEAMACGVPQIATDVGGTREAVTADTGRLVPPHDPPALAAAVLELLADGGARASMATASRERHAERFTIDRMVAATARVYREVVLDT